MTTTSATPPRPEPKAYDQAVTDMLDAIVKATTPPEFVEVEVLPRADSGGAVTADTLVREIRVQTGALPTDATEPSRKRFSGLGTRGLTVELKGIDPVAARYVVSGITKTSATAVEVVVAAWYRRLGGLAGQDGAAA